MSRYKTLIPLLVAALFCLPTYSAQKTSWTNTALNDITGTKESALNKRIKAERKINKTKFGISFDQPTYVLPFYYTSNPAKNSGPTPDNQPIKKEEFKAQFSFKFPIWPNMFKTHYSIGASYTQLLFWQFYAKSQYFRETDYMPAVYVSDHFRPNWLIDVGAVHQSNGRGGAFERSWNRAYADLTFSGTNWLISIKPWMLIFQADSSDRHNKDIAKYLGYERVVIAYKFHSQEISGMVRNSFESGFQRMALQVGYAFPIHGILTGYVQYFWGYGQSLIEYNQRTSGIGVGIALSNWI